MQWKQWGENNVLQGEGFRISHLKKDGGLVLEWAPQAYGGETALIDESNGKQIFYILDGDWRQEYEPLVPQGFEACKAFFDSKPEFKSMWSN